MPIVFTLFIAANLTAKALIRLTVSVFILISRSSPNSLVTTDSSTNSAAPSSFVATRAVSSIPVVSSSMSSPSSLPLATRSASSGFLPLANLP